jgi:hypothetical protein
MPANTCNVVYSDATPSFPTFTYASVSSAVSYAPSSSAQTYIHYLPGAPAHQPPPPTMLQAPPMALKSPVASSGGAAANSLPSPAAAAPAPANYSSPQQPQQFSA